MLRTPPAQLRRRLRRKLKYVVRFNVPCLLTVGALDKICMNGDVRKRDTLGHNIIYTRHFIVSISAKSEQAGNH